MSFDEEVGRSVEPSVGWSDVMVIADVEDTALPDVSSLLISFPQLQSVSMSATHIHRIRMCVFKWMTSFRGWKTALPNNGRAVSR